jgi:hypothetical protein
MAIEFFHGTPRSPAMDRMNALLEASTVCTMGAVCYVTEPGVRLLRNHLAKIKRRGSFFVVGADPPTDVQSVNDLIAASEDHVRAHIRASFSQKLPEGSASVGLMHSKLIYGESEREAMLWVGSHNLTHSAMGGVNIEAAVVVSGDRAESHFVAAREHLSSIWKGAPAGPIEVKDLDLDYGERVVVIDCEMSEEQIADVKGKARFHMTVILRHPVYDGLCIPAKNPSVSARVRAFLPGDITDEGPQSPPKAVFSAKFTGVQFTEKNRERGEGRERITEVQDGALVEASHPSVPCAKAAIQKLKLARLRFADPKASPDDWTIGLLEISGSVDPNDGYDLDVKPYNDRAGTPDTIRLPDFENLVLAREIFGEDYVDGERTLTTSDSHRRTVVLSYTGNKVPSSYERLQMKAASRGVHVRAVASPGPYRFIRYVTFARDK